MSRRREPANDSFVMAEGPNRLLRKEGSFRLPKVNWNVVRFRPACVTLEGGSVLGELALPGFSTFLDGENGDHEACYRV